jgi:hypothetical protein
MLANALVLVGALMAQTPAGQATRTHLTPLPLVGDVMQRRVEPLLVPHQVVAPVTSHVEAQSVAGGASLSGTKVVTNLETEWKAASRTTMTMKVPVAMFESNGSATGQSVTLGAPEVGTHHALLSQDSDDAVDLFVAFGARLPLASADKFNTDPDFLLAALPHVGLGTDVAGLVRLDAELCMVLREPRLIDTTLIGSTVVMQLHASSTNEGVVHAAMDLKTELPLLAGAQLPVADLLGGVEVDAGDFSFSALAGPAFGQVDGVGVHVIVGMSWSPN